LGYPPSTIALQERSKSLLAAPMIGSSIESPKLQTTEGPVLVFSFLCGGTHGLQARLHRKEYPMSVSLPCKLIVVATLLSPISVMAQSGGTGGSGSAAGAASGSSTGSASPVGTPNAGSTGAGTSGVGGVPSGPANGAGLNNSANDPSGAGNSAKSTNAPGTNSAGTASSSGSPPAAGNAPKGSTTVGTAGNSAGGVAEGRIDGTATSGPAMQGDDAVRAEDTPNSAIDKKIKSICKGC
jgi:hypothetical protein